MLSFPQVHQKCVLHRPHLKPIFHFAPLLSGYTVAAAEVGRSFHACLFVHPIYKGDVLDCKAAQLVDLHKNIILHLKVGDL